MTAAALIPCSAVSLNAGTGAVRAQFQRGVGPKAGLYAIDYSFYSPVKGSGDKTKYPLVVLLGGTKSGEYPGKETSNDFVLWASDEYQARFKKSGGAFILFARAPEEKALYWWVTTLYPGLMAAITDFQHKNSANIDASRIYIGAWCAGGQAAWQVSSQNPGYFAAVFPMSSFYGPTAAEVKALRDTPIWIVHNPNDATASYPLNAKAAWNNIEKYSNVKNRCRFTTFGGSYDSAKDNHNAWSYVANEFTKGDYLSTEQTVDGSGSKVPHGSFIEWLSSQSLDNTEIKCTCECHSSNGFTKFFFQIKIFFSRIFGIEANRVCGYAVQSIGKHFEYRPLSV